MLYYFDRLRRDIQQNLIQNLTELLMVMQITQILQIFHLTQKKSFNLTQISQISQILICHAAWLSSRRGAESAEVTQIFYFEHGSTGFHGLMMRGYWPHPSLRSPLPYDGRGVGYHRVRPSSLAAGTMARSAPHLSCRHVARLAPHPNLQARWHVHLPTPLRGGVLARGAGWIDDNSS